MEDSQFLINLCPHIQYIEIQIEEDTLQYITQIILSNHGKSSSHIFLLFIWNTVVDLQFFERGSNPFTKDYDYRQK
jgi:hypothetical protein